jgi:Asp-tRNA(Asn)/Glu-tRNA(Gln) amidotransferase A subunit family amidase
VSAGPDTVPGASAGTAAEAVEAALRRADEHDPQLGVYMTRFDDAARRRAAQLDVAAAAGAPRGPLHGVVVAVKDNIAVAEGPTTAQSTVLDPEWGRDRDAVVVERLKAAGAIVIGKTTLHELAVGHPEPPGRFPEARNPWAPDRYAGGSSSGSAAGVAADLFPIALGSDTGGSLRIPASLCGVTTLMPTYGRVPLAGCVPLSFTIDRIGPIARTAREAAVTLEAIAGPHPSDPAAAEREVERFGELLDGSVAGLRIGVERAHHFPDGTDPDVAPAFEEALAVLEQAGAELVEVTLPHWDEAVAAHAVIEGAESLACHQRELRERWDELTPWTRLAFSRGALVTGADYVQAQRVRRVVQKGLARLFREVDVVASPTLGIAAVPLEELYASTEATLSLFHHIHTRYWNTVGNPVMSIPMGFTRDRLPLGLQLAARPFAESLVLRTADAYQRRTSWHEHHALPASEGSET